jgi:hypothetical protein
MNVRGMGSMTWRDVASIIQERFAAGRTGPWLHSFGIHPAD